MEGRREVSTWTAEPHVGRWGMTRGCADPTLLCRIIEGRKCIQYLTPVFLSNSPLGASSATLEHCAKKFEPLMPVFCNSFPRKLNSFYPRHVLHVILSIVKQHSRVCNLPIYPEIIRFYSTRTVPAESSPSSSYTAVSRQYLHLRISTPPASSSSLQQVQDFPERCRG